jgi:hypothetical protein
VAARAGCAADRRDSLGRVCRAEGFEAYDPARLLLELAVFGSGVAALLAAGEATLGLVFAALAAVHLTLTFALGQRPRPSHR